MKNEKGLRAGQGFNWSKEVNYSSSPTGQVISEFRNILIVESTIEAKVLLITEESTSWIFESIASYHVTPFWSHFRSYTTRDFEPIRNIAQ